MQKRRKRGKASGGSKSQRRGSVSRAAGSAGRKGNRQVKDRAVDYCISHGILSEILRLHRGEVLGMLLEEFDAEKYERTIRILLLLGFC